jgi:hypothetical protein
LFRDDFILSHGRAAMHAATVELLVQKAHLDPDAALAIATAIDMALQNARLVTVDVLDLRFAASEAKIDARFAAFEAKIDARFTASEAKVDARFVAFEARMDARFADAEAKTNARFAASEARFSTFEAKVDARFVAFEAKIDGRFRASDAKTEAALQKMKAELVRWVFLVMLGNVALSAAANALMNALQHLR